MSKPQQPIRNIVGYQLDEINVVSRRNSGSLFAILLFCGTTHFLRSYDLLLVNNTNIIAYDSRRRVLSSLEVNCVHYCELVRWYVEAKGECRAEDGNRQPAKRS